MDHLAGAGVPCSAVFDTDDNFQRPHLNERNMIRTIEHPVVGAFQLLAPPIHMSEPQAELQRRAVAGRAHRRGARAGTGTERRRDSCAGGRGVVGVEPPCPLRPELQPAGSFLPGHLVAQRFSSGRMVMPSSFSARLLSARALHQTTHVPPASIGRRNGVTRCNRRHHQPPMYPAIRGMGMRGRRTPAAAHVPFTRAPMRTLLPPRT